MNGSDRVPPGVYKHWKGKQYVVLGTAKNTETNEELVIYRSADPREATEWFARPLNGPGGWLDPVPGPDVERFRLLVPIRTIQ